MGPEGRDVVTASTAIRQGIAGVLQSKRYRRMHFKHEASSRRHIRRCAMITNEKIKAERV